MKVDIQSSSIGQVFNADIINYQPPNLNWKTYIEDKTLVAKRELRLFISYSHEDIEIKKEFDHHLATLQRSYPLSIWCDEEIIPGQEWNNAIKQSLLDSDVILLLVSAGFIASKYIWENELSEAIRRHDLNQTIVIPIFLKPCMFANMPFAKIQGLPQYAKPISTADNRDEAMASVVKGIQLVLDRLMRTTI